MRRIVAVSHNRWRSTDATKDRRRKHFSRYDKKSRSAANDSSGYGHPDDARCRLRLVHVRSAGDVFVIVVVDCRAVVMRVLSDVLAVERCVRVKRTRLRLQHEDRQRDERAQDPEHEWSL